MDLIKTPIPDAVLLISRPPILSSLKNHSYTSPIPSWVRFSLPTHSPKLKLFEIFALHNQLKATTFNNYKCKPEKQHNCILKTCSKIITTCHHVTPSENSLYKKSILDFFFLKLTTYLTPIGKKIQDLKKIKIIKYIWLILSV